MAFNKSLFFFITVYLDGEFFIVLNMHMLIFTMIEDLKNELELSGEEEVNLMAIPA